ncbi:SDR family NAD(P)-dependent oxidoreductase [Novosphingobium aquae]|uniref:SDR family oxidoreductase n=1 Tax=Novosphingobium aquae TaxID=3133435 RepID=A0ABU8SEZ4_9SPHN
MDRLANKVAIVFGAGPNIGGTIAHFLAREGAKVVVSDISLAAAEETVDFIRTRGFTAHAVQGNATIEADVRRIVAETVQTYGRVDIAVNMAGRVHFCHLLDMDMDDWNESVLSFPTAGLLTTRYTAKAMIDGGHGGSIIHLLSTAAHFGEADATAYTSSKAALLSFARSAAMDLAQYGIRVNTVTPCSMEHQLWTLMRDEVLDPEWQRPERGGFYSRDDYLKMLPLGRFPRASDLAWATVFLASDEAAIITGIDIPVDAGLRHKYPTWTPGDHSGANIRDFVAKTHITRFGETQEKLIPEPPTASGQSDPISQEN